MNLKLILAATAAGALCAGAPPAAHATFPGTNGDIVFGAYDENDTSGLYAQKPGGLPVRFLETGSDTPNNADVSPDGTKVLWSSNDYKIWVADRDGTDARQLSPEDWTDWTPSWSPDGRSIVFSAQEPEEDTWELYRMDADGTGRAKIGGGIVGTSPVLSPDGTKIAYNDFWDTATNIMLVDADGGGEPVDIADGRDPDWTPDGRSVIFGSADYELGELSLWSVEIASGVVRRLTDPDDEIIYAYPSVSPDGTKIVALSADLDRIPRGELGYLSLRTMNMDGSDVQVLPQTDYARDPDWAPGPKADEPDKDDDKDEQDQTPPPVAVQQPAAPAAEQRAAAPSTARACVSRRFFTVRARGRKLRKVSMTVHGRPVKVARRGGAFQGRVDLRGLPRGTFSVRIKKTGAGGRTVSETRRYRTCTPRRG